jgi:signal transduction histidine kinase
VIKKLLQEMPKNSQLTTQGFLLFSPISILAFPVSVLIANPQANELGAFTYGIALTITTFVVYKALIELLKLFPPIPVIRHLAFFIIPFITGFVRGVGFYYLVDFLSLNQPSDFLNRILSSAFTTTFWLILSNYVVSISRNFRFQYQSALNQYLLGSRNRSHPVALSPDSQEVLDNLQLRLASSVEKYLDKSDPASFRSLSALLTEQINDQIRPLSRRIFIRNLSELPLVRYKQLLRDTLNNLNFSWKLFYLIITSLAVISNISIRTFEETFWRCFFFLLPLVIIMLIYRRVHESLGNVTTKLNIGFLFFTGIIPVLVSEYFVHVLKYSGNWIATLTISPVAPVIIFVLSLLRLTQQDRSMIIGMLEDSSKIQVKQIPAEIDMERASIASYLHNTLQSELMALSRQLEVAANEHDPQRSAELLQRVSSRVNRSIADDYREFAQSPRERLDAVVNSWQGILSINIKNTDLLFSVQSKGSLIVQTIEEIATNISRYDMATELDISALKKGGNVVLEFQSNGQGKLVRTKGIGTAWLDRIAQSQWIIEKNKIGTLLTIEI